MPGPNSCYSCSTLCRGEPASSSALVILSCFNKVSRTSGIAANMVTRMLEPSPVKKPRISCKAADQSFLEYSARNCSAADFGRRFAQLRRDFFMPAPSSIQSSNSIVYPTAFSAVCKVDPFNRSRDRMLPITPPESPGLLCLPIPSIASKSRIFYPTQNESQISGQHTHYPEACSSISAPSCDDISCFSGKRDHYPEVHSNAANGFPNDKRRLPDAMLANEEAECLPAGGGCLQVEEEWERMLHSPIFGYREGDKVKKSPLAGSCLHEEQNNGDICLVPKKEDSEPLQTAMSADDKFTSNRGGDEHKKSPVAKSLPAKEPNNRKICQVPKRERGEPLKTAMNAECEFTSTMSEENGKTFQSVDSLLPKGLDNEEICFVPKRGKNGPLKTAMSADNDCKSNCLTRNDKDKDEERSDQKQQTQTTLESTERNTESSDDANTTDTDTKSSITDPCPLQDILLDDYYHCSIPKVKTEPLDTKTDRRHEKVACKIYGLLSVQGTRERRYEITVDELRRRVNAPEHLNKVDMISYVRLAKNSARDLLQKHGIVQPLHNRKSKHTILSKVSERECQELADGINSLNTTYFPTELLAKKNVKAVKTDRRGLKRNVERRFQELEITSSVLSRMMESIAACSSCEKEMKEFDLITHTFGIRNLCHHIEFLVNYMEEEKAKIHKIFKKQ